MIATQHQTNDCNTTPNQLLQYNIKQKIAKQQQTNDCKTTPNQ
jgi:hypothetical protein